MKQDIDRLMKERELDVIIVAGKVHANPAMYYMTNGTVGGYVIKKRGEEPVLLCSPIERDEAAASGLAIVNMSKYDFMSILREKTDRLDAVVELYRRIFADLEVSGKVGFYGVEDRGRAWVELNALDAQLESIEVYGDFDVTLIDAARATKDEDEARRIREIGQRTCDIIGQTVEFLQSHGVKDGALVQADGSPLAIGRVHEQINRFIAEQRLEDPEGFIFAIGRDAGVPHSRGNLEDIVELGKTIVFDIFPCEAGGGYFADVTRTFCLGHALPEVENAYRDVYECHEHAAGSVRDRDGGAALPADDVRLFREPRPPHHRHRLQDRGWLRAHPGPRARVGGPRGAALRGRALQHRRAPARSRLYLRAGSVLSRPGLWHAHRGRPVD